MTRLRSPKNRLGSIFLMMVKIYLISFFVGCASTRPLPVEEARELQTRTYETDYDTLFDAAKAGLQDLNYTIKTIDFEAGTIVAGRNTDRMLGEIATEREGLPTWAIALLIVTGVILVVGAIALFSGSGDDDDDEEAEAQNITHVTNVYEAGDDDYGGDFYHYDVTLNFRPLNARSTEIRVNAEGRQIEDGEVAKAGLVHDPAFYVEFFSALESAVDRIEGD